MTRLWPALVLLPEVKVRVPTFILLVNPLLLNLDQLLLHGVVGCAEDRGGEYGEAFLLKNVVDLSMFAADVEQELVLLLKHGVAEAAPQVVHQTRELLRQLLHEVAAAVLLQLVQAVHLLLANLTLQLVIAVCLLLLVLSCLG